jgi:hypothetical protein
MLGMFVKGKTIIGVGDVLQELHRAAEEFHGENEDPECTLAHPYHLLKSSTSALTSHAGEGCQDVGPIQQFCHSSS